MIIPQSESISRINGSKMGANELLVGETRQKFQTNVSDHFQDVLKDKHLSLLYGLVRHIYIPKDIRTPLQEGYVSDELKLTREEERTTKTAEGELREAEKKVIQETEKVRNETAKMVAAAIAEGQKEVGEIEAATKQQVAGVEKQIAEFDAKKTEQLGRATATADQLMKEAQSQKFDLAVKAFGNSGAYTKWQFAEGLPEDIQLQLFYAGEGTLWTDLKGITPTLPLTNPPPAPKPAVKPASGCARCRSDKWPAPYEILGCRAHACVGVLQRDRARWPVRPLPAAGIPPRVRPRVGQNLLGRRLPRSPRQDLSSAPAPNPNRLKRPTVTSRAGSQIKAARGHGPVNQADQQGVERRIVRFVREAHLARCSARLHGNDPNHRARREWHAGLESG